MNEKEEIKLVLEREHRWVQYRQKMLDIIEEKLLKMREIAELAKLGNLTSGEREELNARQNKLASQVKVLDRESRRIDDRTTLN